MNVPQRDIKPRYEVERLTGEVEVDKLVPHTRTIKQGTKTRETTTWKHKKVMEPAGFMVYLPNKSSYRVRDEEKLRELGLDVPPGEAVASSPDLVDMDTGELVPRVDPVSLKDQVKRAAQPTRKSKLAATEAVAAS